MNLPQNIAIKISTKLYCVDNYQRYGFIILLFISLSIPFVDFYQRKENYMTLNERIVNLCEKKGISQSKLEKDLGIAKGSVTKWKTQEPRHSTMEKVADYFGVSVEYIMTGEETSGYYLNEESAKLAQEMYEDEDMRSLFDMKRNMPPERFKAHMEFMKNLYRQEKGEDI